MKILVANKFFYPAGGPETVLFNSIEALKSMGHEVIPFSMKHSSNIPTPYSKYFVTEVNYHDQNGSLVRKLKIATSLIYSWEAKKKMERLLEDSRPDVAHLHNIYHQISPSILPVLKRSKIPVVLTLHDFKLVCPNYIFLRDGHICEECEGKYFYKAIKRKCVKDSYLKSTLSVLEIYFHKLMKTYVNNVDIFIVLSQFSKERFIKYGLPEEKMLTLPNCINTVQYRPSNNSKRYILFFGRLSEQNGISTLVKAMLRIPQIELKIAGDGSLMNSLKEFVEENDLKNVSFLGFVKGEPLKKLIAESYFTVFPNHYYHLCPMSILESLALAKPVVGSNLGSVPEFVEDGVDGLLFEPGNSFDLAEKIKYLYQKPLLVKKMGIAGSLKIENRFSKDAYYPRLLKIYQNLLKGIKIGYN